MPPTEGSGMEIYMKFIDKHKMEKKIKENERQSSKIKDEMELLENKIKTSCCKIGQIIIEQAIEVNNEEIKELREVIKNTNGQIKSLVEKQESGKKELFLLEKSLRNMEGKIGCSKCGRVYEKRKDLVFCSKCGTNLKQ